MDIKDSDSDYQSGLFPTLSERLARHRRRVKDYSSDGSDEDSGQDHPGSLFAPETVKALPCDYESLVWERFRKMVIDGVEMPPSIFQNHCKDYCKHYMEDMYEKASSSFLKEEEASHRF